MIRSVPDGIEITVKAVPGAKRDAIVGTLGDALKVKVSAPPEGGKANDAICKLIADRLGVAARDVMVISGHGNPRKRIRIQWMSESEARERLT